MRNHERFFASPFIPVFAALILSLAFFGCESPTAPGPSTNNGLGGSGAIDPGATGAFLLGAVSDSAIGPGTLEVWAMDVAFEDSTGMVTFDVQIKNQTERTIAPPIHFVITSVTPHDVSVVDFDGSSPDGFPFYDFSAKLGADNVLSPGERTERVTMKFHTVTARSFAIGFRIDLGPPAGLGVIGGVVFNDADEDGRRDRDCRCEWGIPRITVALEKKLENGDMVTLITRTDSMGEYRFTGLKEGAYKVFVAPPPNMWRITTPNPLLVALVKGADGKVQDFLGAHFGLYPLTPPPGMNLFGPITTSLHSRFGPEIDSTFVNPPSPLTVVYKYYLWVEEPPMSDFGVVDSADAWINGEMVFTYRRPAPPDTIWIPFRFERQIIQIPDSLVNIGENTIRLSMKGEEWAALTWRVYKQP